jgi:hypothetical protein
VVDDWDGRALLPFNRQSHLGHLDESVVIDPDERVMYLTTFHQALCVKIPDDL